MTIPSLPLDPAVVEKLSGVTTATLTTVLLKKGLRNVWLRGAFPKQPGQRRVAGIAFTLRRLAPEPLFASALLLFLVSHAIEIPGNLAAMTTEDRDALLSFLGSL